MLLQLFTSFLFLFRMEVKEDKPVRRTSKEVTLGEDTKMCINVFLALLETATIQDQAGSQAYMNTAIDLIKQAKEGLQ